MQQDMFRDYYETLQVSPGADQETIEKVFRMLAKRCHPDNPQTGDVERFNALVEAYRVLSNPEKRAAYDVGYDRIQASKWHLRRTVPSPEGGGDNRSVRHSILSVLYAARRRSTLDPGVGIVSLEQVIECPQAQMEFHLWYLKEKGWIQRTENGTFAITAGGVDAVEERGDSLRNDRLLTDGLPENGNGQVGYGQKKE